MERGIAANDGFVMFAEFLRLLDESTVSADGSMQSVCPLLHRSLGEEEAYHFCGLMTGDDHGMAATELIGYKNYRLRRFHKLTEMWELERQWQREDAESAKEWLCSRPKLMS